MPCMREGAGAVLTLMHHMQAGWTHQVRHTRTASLPPESRYVPSGLNARLLTGPACQCRVSLAKVASRTSFFLPACSDELPVLPLAAAATAAGKAFQRWIRPVTSPAAMRSSPASIATHCKCKLPFTAIHNSHFDVEGQDFQIMR